MVMRRVNTIACPSRIIFSLHFLGRIRPSGVLRNPSSLLSVCLTPIPTASASQCSLSLVIGKLLGRLGRGCEMLQVPRIVKTIRRADPEKFV